MPPDTAPLRSNFGVGTVSNITKNSIEVVIPHGSASCLISSYRNSGACAQDFDATLRGLRRDTAVVCTWRTKREDGRPPKGVHPTSIEPADLWQRREKWITKYPEHANMPGKLAEPMLVETLQLGGILAQHATTYEDERLGVDAWVKRPLLHEGGRWVWLPVDFTCKNLTNGCPEGQAKVDSCRKRGVLPIGIPLHFIGEPARAIPWFLKCVGSWMQRFEGVELLDRRAAHMLEDSAAPNH